MRARLGARIITVSALLGCVLSLALAVALCSGSSAVPLSSVFQALAGSGPMDAGSAIVAGVRLPRALLAALAGASLSLGGMVFQALLRNPLADPYILGVSGGSAIGAVAAVVCGWVSFQTMAAGAFAGGASASALVLSLAWFGMKARPGDLLLSGVMVNAFCSAVILFLITVAKQSSLHSVLFWLMGNLSSPAPDDLLMLCLVLAPCFTAIFLLSHTMNLLLLGESQAKSLGVNVGGAVAALTIVVSLMVAATVSFCGLLGFVGLVVPHALRLVLGPDHRVLAPACCLGGAAYLVLCDTLARSMPAGSALPTGVVTAALGAPVFIYLLKRRGHGQAS